MFSTGAVPSSIVSQGQSMHYRCLLILILGPVLCSVTEACGRTPATPKPTPPPHSASTTSLPSPPPHHRINCTASESAKTACLNDGNCFVVVIAGDRVASCHCPKRFIGDRCQELSTDIFGPTLHDPGRIATASIAGSIVLLVIVTVVVVVCIVYHLRMKKKRRSRDNELRKICDEPDAHLRAHNNGNNSGNKKEEEDLILNKLDNDIV